MVSLAVIEFGPTELGWATLPARLVGALAGAARGTLREVDEPPPG